MRVKIIYTLSVKNIFTYIYVYGIMADVLFEIINKPLGEVINGILYIMPYPARTPHQAKFRKLQWNGFFEAGFAVSEKFYVIKGMTGTKSS